MSTEPLGKQIKPGLEAMAAGSGVRSVLGTMEFGRRAGPEASGAMLRAFLARGHSHLDTAHMYAGGESERIVGALLAAEPGVEGRVKIATKANPWDGKTLKAQSVRSQLEESLQRLRLPSVDLFYLHAPDHETPVEETLRACNELHRERLACPTTPLGRWQKSAPFAKPTSGCCRRCTRHFGMSFYAYNPLAGGLLTGKYKYEDKDLSQPPTGRFFGNDWARVYRDRYWKQHHFEGDKYGDAVIIGMSNMDQLQENLRSSEEGPLVLSVVEAFEKAWHLTAHDCPNYFR
ncbi:putative Aflatoxin aldehyde reductase protein [Naja naja]|nr:putative Aflatoxin aldehyde reductase protein [Naja naja]